jgi:hypothetical protein
MGCDYFIEKFLEIKFVNIMFSLTMVLEIDKGYYSFSLDEDHPTYDEKYTEYVEKTLEPGMEPIIIYEYDQFVTKKLENKYRRHIEQELERYNNSRSLVQRKEWKDIREIVKRECRYERD